MTKPNDTLPQSPLRIQAQRIEDLEAQITRIEAQRWFGVPRRVARLKREHPQVLAGICVALWGAVAFTALLFFRDWPTWAALTAGSAAVAWGMRRHQLLKPVQLDLYHLLLTGVAVWLAFAVVSGAQEHGVKRQPLARGFQQIDLTVPSANVREGPGMEYPSFATVQDGEEVQVVESDAYWTRLEDREGQRGWVANSLIASR